MSKVKRALETLKVKGRIKIESLGLHRFRVILNGDYFGTYDTQKETFVD